MVHLGRHSFRIILNSVNGVIDLGIPEGITILHMAAKSGNRIGCRRILKWKPDYYDNVTLYGETAFSFAAQKGHKDTCEEIVKLSRVKNGGHNDFQAIKMILHQDMNGFNALHKAVNTGHQQAKF